MCKIFRSVQREDASQKQRLSSTNSLSTPRLAKKPL